MLDSVLGALVAGPIALANRQGVDEVDPDVVAEIVERWTGVVKASGARVD